MNRSQKCKVLVTGGSGLVGKAIADEVERNNELKRRFTFIFLSSKDADLRDIGQTRPMFNSHKPEYVINLAAKVGGLFANMRDNAVFYQSNLDINKNVLKCCSEFEVIKCISCLSTCIFPALVEYPLDETKIHMGPPHNSNQGYSLAKRQVDLLNKEYNTKSNGKSLFTAVVPTNIYGKNDNFCLNNSHVIPSLIHKAYLSALEAKAKALKNAALEVCGSGRPLRQFIYAPDLAKLLLWVLEEYHDPDPLILSPDVNQEVSIGHMAEIVCEIMSKKFDVKIKPSYNIAYSDGQYRKPASNQKLQNLLPNFRFTPPETGLSEVIDWFCENYQSVRK